MRPPESHYPAAQTQGHRKWWAAGRMKFGRAGADCSELVDSQGVLLAEGRLPPWLGAKPGVIPDSSYYRRWLCLVLPYFSRPFLSVQRPSLPDCTISFEPRSHGDYMAPVSGASRAVRLPHRKSSIWFSSSSNTG